MQPIGKIPSLSDLTQYDVNRRGQYEGTRQSLYDSATYDGDAGHTQLQFFQVPRGQSSKTAADTNMTSAGQLPQPQHFLVQSVEVYFYPSAMIVTESVAAPAESEFSNDVYTVAKSGSLKFFIGSKTYLEEAPLNRFPPKTRLDCELYGTFAQDSGEDQMMQGDYAAWVGRPYYLDPPILLVPNQNFSVELNWPSAIVLPSGTDAKIFVVLDGILYRQSQ